MGENRLMADLYEENQRLKARISELEEKHWNECRQIAHYDDELKDLREENKVLMQECDRLIKEKGELLSKVSGGDVLRICQLEEQFEKAKRLLKAAVEDIRYLINHAKRNGKACDRCKYGNEMYCYADDCSNDAKWQHEAEALALIGEDTNVPAREDGAENG